MIIDPTIDTAIAANLDALAFRLRYAATIATSASAAFIAEQRNMSVGIILDLERLLPEAQALYAAVLALHRGTRAAAVRAEGGAI